MIELYKIDSKGKVRIWRCWHGYNDQGTPGIFTQDGIQGGKIKDPVFTRAEAKNVGKANFRSAEDQAEEMVKQKTDKKLSKDYFKTVEEAQGDTKFFPTGCPSGMIWEDYKDKSHVVYPALASAKLDGSKMYSTWREERVFLNTRSAKEHKNFRHIEEDLKDFYYRHPNIVLDGEAYNHDFRDRFEDLQSIFRKSKPSEEDRELSKSIAKFYVYDVVDLNQPNMNAVERQELLENLFEQELFQCDYLVHWPSYLVVDEQDYDTFHERCMDKGFEGTVLKIADQPYIQRKNKYVMKRKPKFDCEFKIVDIIEGEGTNAGMAATVKLSLATPHGMNEDHEAKLDKTAIQDAGFATGWNAELKTKCLLEKDKYIGQWATFEYGGLTKYNKLRFPKFKSLRPNLD